MCEQCKEGGLSEYCLDKAEAPAIPVDCMVSRQDGPSVDEIIDWADGILGALGTEHAHKVTEMEAVIAGAVMKASKSLAC